MTFCQQLHPSDWRFLGCQIAKGSTVQVNAVGTFKNYVSIILLEQCRCTGTCRCASLTSAVSAKVRCPSSAFSFMALFKSAAIGDLS